MAILMKAEVRGQTRDGYQQVFDALASHYAAAPGFIVHMSHPMEGGWCVIDVWRTRKDFERFFGEHVAPKLPATVRPKVTFLELHDLHQATAS
jgi:heme-degrading monooxygenase HmoA